MATGTWTTTADEDAAITALTGETPDVFVNRHIRHQVDFAVSQQVRVLSVDAYIKATPEDRAAVDAILAKTKDQK